MQKWKTQYKYETSTVGSSGRRSSGNVNKENFEVVVVALAVDVEALRRQIEEDET